MNKLERKRQEDLRRKIQASVLLTLLHHAATGRKKISNERIRAAEILLKKTLPDLANVTLSGDDDAPVKVQAVEYEIIKPKKRDE